MNPIPEYERIETIIDGECECCGHFDREKGLYSIDGRKFFYFDQAVVEKDPASKHGIRVWTDLFEMDNRIGERDPEEFIRAKFEHILDGRAPDILVKDTLSTWRKRFYSIDLQ